LLRAVGLMGVSSFDEEDEEAEETETSLLTKDVEAERSRLAASISNSSGHLFAQHQRFVTE